MSCFQGTLHLLGHYLETSAPGNEQLRARGVGFYPPAPEAKGNFSLTTTANRPLKHLFKNLSTSHLHSLLLHSAAKFVPGERFRMDQWTGKGSED